MFMSVKRRSHRCFLPCRPENIPGQTVLLVSACDTGNGVTGKSGQPRQRPCQGAADAAGGNWLRQNRARDGKGVKQRLIPAELVNVEKHGAGGVGIVDHMGFSAGEIPD